MNKNKCPICNNETIEVCDIATKGDTKEELCRCSTCDNVFSRNYKYQFVNFSNPIIDEVIEI